MLRRRMCFLFLSSAVADDNDVICYMMPDKGFLNAKITFAQFWIKLVYLVMFERKRNNVSKFHELKYYFLSIWLKATATGNPKFKLSAIEAQYIIAYLVFNYQTVDFSIEIYL